MKIHMEVELKLMLEDSEIHVWDSLGSGEWDPDSTDIDGLTPLMRACFTDCSTDIVHSILELKADVGKENQWGCIALHFASRYCDSWTCKEILEAIITSGAYIDHQNSMGETPIFYAVRGDSIEAITTLIAFDANINHKNDRGNTPLGVGILHGSQRAIKLLLDHGAENIAEKWIYDINDFRISRPSILPSIRASYNYTKDQVKGCIIMKTDFSNSESASAYIMASSSSSISVRRRIHMESELKFMLQDSGMHAWDSLGTGEWDPDLIDEDGFTSLMRACFTDRSVEFVQSIIELKADVGKQNEWGYTALHIASRYCGPETSQAIIYSIVESGAYIHHETRRGETPIFYAVRGDSVHALATLIDLNADINYTNRNGKTPLGVAKIHNSQNSINLLLELGAKHGAEKWICEINSFHENAL